MVENLSLRISNGIFIESNSLDEGNTLEQNDWVRAVGPVVETALTGIRGLRNRATERVDTEMGNIPVEHILRIQRWGPIFAKLAFAVAVNTKIDDDVVSAIQIGITNTVDAVSEGIENTGHGLVEIVMRFGDNLNPEEGEGISLFGGAKEIQFQEEDCVTPKRGDTPFKIWGSNWVKEAKKHGLTVNAGETGVDRFVAGETYCEVAKEVVQATPTPEPVATETVVPPPTPTPTPQTIESTTGSDLSNQLEIIEQNPAEGISKKADFLDKIPKSIKEIPWIPITVGSFLLVTGLGVVRRKFRKTPSNSTQDQSIEPIGERPELPPGQEYVASEEMVEEIDKMLEVLGEILDKRKNKK